MKRPLRLRRAGVGFGEDDAGSAADLVAGVAADAEGVAEVFAGFVDEGLNGDVGVFDEALFEENDLGVELGEFAFEDFVDDVGGFALDLFGVEGFFGVDEFRREAVAGEGGGGGGGDVEGDFLAEFDEGIGGGVGGVFAADFDHDADFAAEVDVFADGAFALEGVGGIAVDDEVFADFADFEGEVVFFSGGEFVVADGEAFLGEFGDEGLEVLVFGDEVGFAVHFDHGAGFAVGGDGDFDEAFVGGAVGFFGGDGESAFAEEFDGGFEVTVGVLKGFFAFHHADVGDGAEFFDLGCGNLRHEFRFLKGLGRLGFGSGFFFVFRFIGGRGFFGGGGFFSDRGLFSHGSLFSGGGFFSHGGFGGGRRFLHNGGFISHGGCFSGVGFGFGFCGGFSGLFFGEFGGGGLDGFVAEFLFLVLAGFAFGVGLAFAFGGFGFGGGAFACLFGGVFGVFVGGVLDGFAEDADEALEGADAVIVAGDGVIDDAGIAVGVDDGDDGDAEAAGLLDGDGFADDVDDDQGGGHAFHVGDAAEVAFEFGFFAAEAGAFFFAGFVEGALLVHGLEFAHAADGDADGLVVGEHAAEPAVDDVGLVEALGGFEDDVLGLFFGADEEDLAAADDGVVNKALGDAHLDEAFAEVDHVEAFALSVDVLGHVGVPAFGLVTEVDAGIEKLLQSDGRQVEVVHFHNMLQFNSSGLVTIRFGSPGGGGRSLPLRNGATGRGG